MLNSDFTKVWWSSQRFMYVLYSNTDVETICPLLGFFFFISFKMTIFSWCMLFRKKNRKKEKEMGKQMSQIREIVARWRIHTIYLLCIYWPKLVIAQTFSICKMSYKVNFLLCLMAILREKPIGRMLVPIGPTTGDTDACPWRVWKHTEAIDRLGDLVSILILPLTSSYRHRVMIWWFLHFMACYIDKMSMVVPEQFCECLISFCLGSDS